MNDSILIRLLAILVISLVLRYLWVRMRPVIRHQWHLAGGFAFFMIFVFSLAYRWVPFGQDWMGVLAFGFGGFWMVFLSQWLLACLLRDSLSILTWLRLKALGQGRGAWKAMNRRHDERTVPMLVIAFGAALAIFSYGWKNQQNPEVRHTHLQVERHLEKPVRIAVLSDLHFDPLFQEAKWQKGLDILEEAKPDVLIIAGDITDLSIAEMERLGIGEHLKKLKAPHGVFGITGNHERYMERRDDKVLQWLSIHGIQWIRNETFCLQLVCVTGMDDRTFQNRPRIRDVAPSVASRDHRAWVLVDHQPKVLAGEWDGVKTLPDLGISGHTHAGQFFPWTLVIHSFWDLAKGQGSIQGIPWIVSAGFGQWGPPVRTGSDSEIWIIDISGDR